MPGDGKVETIKDYTDFLNGLTGTGKWLKRTYTYDKLNRQTGIIYTDSMSGSSTAVKQSHSYTYDKNSNITSSTSLQQSTALIWKTAVLSAKHMPMMKTAIR